jgi:hypothetical protein
MRKNHQKYDEMLSMLTVACHIKNIPFTPINYQRMELTIEGICQGIKSPNELELFVDAGLAEKRFMIDDTDERFMIEETDD